MRSGVGIDIGTHAVRVVELSVSENAAVIRKALYLDRKSLAERGVDFSDRAQLAAHLKQAMTAAGIGSRSVALGISGKDSIIRYTHVPPVPSWRLKIIMDYEMNEVSEKIGEKLSSDYRVLPVTRESDDDQAIIIGMAKENALEALLGDLAAQKIMVQKAVPSAIACTSPLKRMAER